MPPTPSLADLNDVLFQLAEEVAAQQARLDQDHAERVRAYLPVLEAVRAAGYETLARDLAPPALALTDTQIRMQFRFASSAETQFAFKVQLLDLGFSRRFAHSSFAQNSFEMKVVRIPLINKPASGANPQPPA